MALVRTGSGSRVGCTLREEALALLEDLDERIAELEAIANSMAAYTGRGGGRTTVQEIRTSINALHRRIEPFRP